MTVAIYLVQKQTTIDEIATREHNIKKAFSDGEEALRAGPDNLIQLERLKEGAANRAVDLALYQNTIVDSLDAEVQAYYDTNPASRTPTKRNDLWTAYGGFDATSLRGAIGKAGEKATAANLWESVQEAYKPVQQRVASSVLEALLPTDGPDVVNYLRTEAPQANAWAIAHINPALLTDPKNMMELVEAQLAKGSIALKDIEGKPFYTP